MNGFMKKQGPAFYLNALAAILGVAGLATMIRCSSMSSAYALTSLGSLVTYAVIGVLFAIVAIYAPNRFGNHDMFSTLAVIGGIALFTTIIGKILNARILLISGLFSYNSGNTLGWSVFYATVAALVCFVVAILCLIAGAFMASVRKSKEVLPGDTLQESGYEQ